MPPRADGVLLGHRTVLQGHGCQTCPEAPEGSIADEAGGPHGKGVNRLWGAGDWGGELGFKGRGQAFTSFQPVLINQQNNPSRGLGVGRRGWAWLLGSGLDSDFPETFDDTYPQKSFFWIMSQVLKEPLFP